ncbi:MAG: hypothetical protein QOJ38_1601, partial [Solirubrobacterales bacterium]|nr:hypothetical protein [Solirubrobacterales bacterium]
MAAAWTLIFLVASWIYVFDPALLDFAGPEDSIAIVNLSLFALIGGVAAGTWALADRAVAPKHVAIARGHASTPVA